MPFEVVKLKRGFKVKDDKGNFYSKKPLTKTMARRQQQALYASENRKELLSGSGFSGYTDDDGNYHIILVGDGWFSDVWTKVKSVANSVATTLGNTFATPILQTTSSALASGIRENYPPEARDTLARYGNGDVYDLKIIREPIQSYIDKALQVITLGRWKQAKETMNYDNLFHLSMIAYLAMPNGDKAQIKIEKNEVINITDRFALKAQGISSGISQHGSGQDARIINVPVPCCITLQEMMDKASNATGPAFFKYDAFNNNCQMFIANILRANGLLTPEVNAFVVQDAESLLQQLPKYTRPFASTITNLAGFANKLMFGEGELEDVEDNVKSTLFDNPIIKGVIKLDKEGKENAKEMIKQKTSHKYVDASKVTGEEKKMLDTQILRRVQLIMRGLQVVSDSGIGDWRKVLKGFQNRENNALVSRLIQGILDSAENAGEAYESLANFLNTPNRWDSLKGGAVLSSFADIEQPNPDNAIKQYLQPDGSWTGDFSLWQQSGFPGCGPNSYYTTNGPCYNNCYEEGEQFACRSDKAERDTNVADIDRLSNKAQVRTAIQDEDNVKRYFAVEIQKENEAKARDAVADMTFNVDGNYTKTDGTMGYDKRFNLEWLNSVTGRHQRDSDPYLEEVYKKLLEVNHNTARRNPEQIRQFEADLEKKFRDEEKARYGDNAEILSPEKGYTLTDANGNKVRVNKVRLRQDGGYDINYGNNQWEYQAGENEWDCNEYQRGDRAEDMNVCGTEGRRQAGEKKAQSINRERDAEWDNKSGWDKFMNGMSVFGSVTQDYILPVASAVLQFVPGVGTAISTGLDIAKNVADYATGDSCRHFNECTDRMVERGKQESLYHTTKGDMIAKRYLEDENWAKLLEPNTKVYGLIRDTAQYGSRAGKLYETGKGRSHDMKRSMIAKRYGKGQTCSKTKTGTVCEPEPEPELTEQQKFLAIIDQLMADPSTGAQSRRNLNTIQNKFSSVRRLILGPSSRNILTAQPVRVERGISREDIVHRMSPLVTIGERGTVEEASSRPTPQKPVILPKGSPSPGGESPKEAVGFVVNRRSTTGKGLTGGMDGLRLAPCEGEAHTGETTLTAEEVSGMKDILESDEADRKSVLTVYRVLGPTLSNEYDINVMNEVKTYLESGKTDRRSTGNAINLLITVLDRVFPRQSGSGRVYEIAPLFRKQLQENKITPEKYLEVARDIAKDQGYDPRALEFSDNGAQKLMIWDDEGNKRHFGAVEYGDYILWSKQEALGNVRKGFADQKRRTFVRSHSKIKGDWRKDKFSPNNLALRILWDE